MLAAWSQGRGPCAIRSVASPSKIDPPDLLRAPFPLGSTPPLKLGRIAGDIILQTHLRPSSDAQG
jgi:hypothetical protein